MNSPVDSVMPLPPTRLVADLKAVGVAPGHMVMVHASMKAVGAVVGGPHAVLQALFEAVGPAGTVMMYAGWEEMPDTPGKSSPVDQAESLGFDPATAPAVREHGVLVEFLRTWPGTERSLNPEASMVAHGRQARWLVENHPLNYGYGLNSPLAKLVTGKGKVLMLGAPLETITLLHHAEALAKLPRKGIVHYGCPVMRDGRKDWIQFEDYNTSRPHADYTFAEIARDYAAATRVRPGTVGRAETWLFDAAGLTDFAVRWLETRFG